MQSCIGTLRVIRIGKGLLNMACKLCNDTGKIVERGMVYTKLKTCELCVKQKPSSELDEIEEVPSAQQAEKKKRGRPKQKIEA